MSRRNDWRVPFPVVDEICQCGAVSYQHTFDRDRYTINGVLVQCSACKPKSLADAPSVLFPHVYKRTHRDVACRYLRRFGGATFSVQTDADDAEIYLRNRHGETIATVSLRNRFSEQVDESIFSDMPF